MIASSRPSMGYNLVPVMHCEGYAASTFSWNSFTDLCCALIFRLAYRGGVTLGITPPSAEGFSVGLSTSFSLSSKHKLEQGAVVQDVVALHVSIGHGSSTPSISTKIAALRRLLLEPGTGESGKWFKKASLVRFHSCHHTLESSLQCVAGFDTSRGASPQCGHHRYSPAPKARGRTVDRH